MASFKPALEKLLQTYLSAVADKKISIREHLLLAADACNTVELLLTGIGTDDAAFNQLVADLEQLVQTHIVPIDLSRFKVPKLLEQLVIDPQSVAAVRPTLEAIRASLGATAQPVPKGPSLGGV